MTVPVLVGLAPTKEPVELGRDQAQQLAVEELAKPEYHVDDPSLSERLIRWLYDEFTQLLDTASRNVPGGWWGLAGLALLIALVIGAALWRGGPVRRTSSGGHALFAGKTRSAADHRRSADRAAATGQWEEAVLERYRAIVRGLEERTILEPHPGRTADEAAAGGGQALPELAGDLAAAAATFDAVAYGGRSACSTDDRFLRGLDRACHDARFNLRPSALPVDPR